MRINKYIAASGITSRRKADELIKQGRVKVNGVLMKEPGYEVSKEDFVEINDKLIYPEKILIYLIMNKPTGFVTTLDDEFDRPTVIDLLPPMDERVYPVGRLDMNTSGLLILTNDGKLANALTHPTKKINKTYKLICKGILTKKEALILEKGVNIGGYFTAPCNIKIIKHMNASSLVEITIHEGKNRQIRKMFKEVKHPVQKLERIAIENIKLGHMKEGTVRKLSDREVESIKHKAEI